MIRSGFLQKISVFFIEFYRKQAILAWLSFGMILAGICVRYPSLSTIPEVYAEGGQTFFYYAYHHQVFENLFEFKWYNYLILEQRLIAIIAVKVFHIIENFAGFIQWVSLVFIGYCYACFNLKIFRSLIASDIARFLISILLGISFLGDYELYAFVNFNYHGMFLMLLFLFTRLEQVSFFFYATNLILIALLLVSKTYPISFFPVYALVFIKFYLDSKSKKFNRNTLFYGISCVLILIQAITAYVVSTKVQHLSKSLGKMDLLQIIQDGFFYYLQSYLHFFLSPTFLRHGHPLIHFTESIQFPEMRPINYGVGLVIVSLFALALFQIRTSSNRKPAYFFLAANFIAYTSLSFTVISANWLSYFPKELTWESLYLPPHNRWFYLSMTCLFLGGIVLLLNCFKSKILQILVTVLLISGAIYTTYDFRSGDSPNPKAYYSHWKVYHKLINSKDYCLPISPYGWMIEWNCRALLKIQTKEQERIALPSVPILWVRGVVLESGAITRPEVLWLVAYGQNGQEIGRGKQITPADEHYQYFLLKIK